MRQIVESETVRRRSTPAIDVIDTHEGPFSEGDAI